VEGVGKGEDLFPDFRGEAEHSHYLGHAGACDPLPEGNFGLTCDLPGFQESFPLVGFSEEFDYSGGLRFPGRFGVTTTGRNSAYHLTWRRSSRQGAEIAVYEGPLGAEGYLDGLFAVGGHRGATVGNLGEMDDPEPDLGVRLAVSRPAHLGSHDCCRPRGFSSGPFLLRLPLRRT